MGISVKDFRGINSSSPAQTGKIGPLANEHYTLVTNYDLEENTLSAKGPVTNLGCRDGKLFYLDPDSHQ